MLIRKIALSCLAAVLAMSASVERADAFYSSTKGRFISRDPIAERGGLNLYGFVGNGPVNGIDPKGQDVWVEGAAKSQPAAHLKICIGNSAASKCWSFGLENGWRILIPFRCGVVYRDGSRGGQIIARFKTTSADDKTMQSIMKGMEGHRMMYGVLYGNCRTFSWNTFHTLYNTFGNKSVGPGVPANPVPNPVLPIDPQMKPF